MQNYNTVQGDRIDLIVLDHYGSHDMLATVLSHNIHLSSISMDLEANITIALPLSEEKINQTEDEENYKGWLTL